MIILLLVLSADLTADFTYELDKYGQVYKAPIEKIQKQSKKELRQIASQKLRQKYSAPTSQCSSTRQAQIRRLDFQCPLQCQNSDYELRVMQKMRDLQKRKQQ